MKYACVHETPLGPMTLVEQDGALVEARFDRRFMPGEAPAQTPLLTEAQAQLDEYFQGRRRDFTVALNPQGTPFCLRCWQALRRIPYGCTITYGMQAEAVGQPKACRAVGRANHLNPLPLFIPCHRVVGKDGKLVGYAGGLEIKQALLALEYNNKGE